MSTTMKFYNDKGHCLGIKIRQGRNDYGVSYTLPTRAQAYLLALTRGYRRAHGR